jgi:hypothetical protein
MVTVLALVRSLSAPKLCFSGNHHRLRAFCAWVAVMEKAATTIVAANTQDT